MAKRLLDYDPLTGRSTYFDYVHHDVDQEIKLITEYDETFEKNVMSVNMDKRGMGREYYARDNEMWHIGSIPASVVQEWITKFGVDVQNPDDMPRVIELLNSSDYQHLKTANITA